MKWMKWLSMDDPARDEWQAAKSRAANEINWKTFKFDEKKQYVVVLFSPFVLSDESIHRFILDVDEG